MIRDSWEELLEPSRYDWLEPAIKNYLAETIVHHGKVRRVVEVRIRQAMRLPLEMAAVLVFADTEFLDGEMQLRVLRLRYEPTTADGLPPSAVVATLTRRGTPVGVLFDARYDPNFCAANLRALANGLSIPFGGGEIAASVFPGFTEARGPDEVPAPITLDQGEQHDLSIVYGKRLILKSFERLEPGISPDIELGRYLMQHTGYDRVAQVVGAIEFRPPEGEPMTISVLSAYVVNEGSAWQYTLDVLSRFYEAVLAKQSAPPASAPPDAWTPGMQSAPPAEGLDLIDGYLRTAEDLGRSTFEMHRALASGASAPAIAPEPFTKLYQRSLYQSMRTTMGLVFRELSSRLPDLPPETRAPAEQLLAHEQNLGRRYRAVLGANVDGYRVRVHGNYHLGELLYTGTGFRVLDFEGDPDRPLTERRIKRSALRDVATMIRSFHYAALSPLYKLEAWRSNFTGNIRDEDRDVLLRWARFWWSWVSARFVQSYFTAMQGSNLIPASPTAARELLELMVLDKAVTELGAELEHRPAWIPIPLAGLLDLTQSPEA